MEDRPEVVYHGSQHLFDVLIPRQAKGQCEAESQIGIYAATTMAADIIQSRVSINLSENS